jgi:GNAT superfamily N-acetyltransferase
MALQIHTLQARPDLRPQVFSADFRPPFWPEFMLHDPASSLYFSPPNFDRYLSFAFACVVGGKVVGRAFSVPFVFGSPDRVELPNDGWDGVIRWAHTDQQLGRRPTAVSALEISLLPNARGTGTAQVILAEMKANARRHGCSSLFAPVRPNEKHLFPAMSITDYLELRRPDGLPQDPWLRTHVRAGGQIIKIAPYAMTIVGTVSDWRRWTGLPLRQSGSVPVPGALSQVLMSLENDVGVYIEPGVWVYHPL